MDISTAEGEPIRPAVVSLIGKNESSEEWDELMGNDIRVKRVQQGDGDSADMKSTVFCSLRVSLLHMEGEDVVLEPIETLYNERYIIGESDCVPGLELPLRHSRPGDHLLVRCHSKFGYGPGGRPVLKIKPSAGTYDAPTIIKAIPPNSNLHFEVFVKDHFDEDPRGEFAAAAAAEELCSTTADDSFFSSAGSTTTELKRRRPVYKSTTSTRGDPLDIIRNKIVFRKEVGNRWFSYKDYAKASRAYAKGIKTAEDYCSRIIPKTPEQVREESVRAQLAEKQSGGVSPEDMAMTETERLNKINATAAARAKEAEDAQRGHDVKLDPKVVEEYVHCLNNLTTSYILLEEWVKAKDVCLRVLELDRRNVKGLIRASQVSLHFSNYDEAQLCLDKAKELEPERPELVGEFAKLNKARAEYRRREKEMSKQMTKRLFPGSNSKSDSNSTNPELKSDTTPTQVYQSDTKPAAASPQKVDSKPTTKPATAEPASGSYTSTPTSKPADVKEESVKAKTEDKASISVATAPEPVVNKTPPTAVPSGEGTEKLEGKRGLASTFVYIAVLMLCVAIGAAVAFKDKLM